MRLHPVVKLHVASACDDVGRARRKSKTITDCVCYKIKDLLDKTSDTQSIRESFMFFLMSFGLSQNQNLGNTLTRH